MTKNQYKNFPKKLSLVKKITPMKKKSCPIQLKAVNGEDSDIVKVIISSKKIVEKCHEIIKMAKKL